MNKLIIFLIILLEALTTLIFSQWQPQTKEELQAAVDMLINDSTNPQLDTYGEINDWDVSLITDMGAMFFQAENFNGNLSSWNVSNVTNMASMFREATSFNQDLSSWDVSSVTNMFYMFGSADAFNQDLSSWDISSVTNIQKMFYDAENFNGDLSSWDVSNVGNMQLMFDNTDTLSDVNKCAIHTSFSINENWPYDWSSYGVCESCIDGIIVDNVQMMIPCVMQMKL